MHALTFYKFPHHQQTKYPYSNASLISVNYTNLCFILLCTEFYITFLILPTLVTPQYKQLQPDPMPTRRRSRSQLTNMCASSSPGAKGAVNKGIVRLYSEAIANEAFAWIIDAAEVSAQPSRAQQDLNGSAGWALPYTLGKRQASAEGQVWRSLLSSTNSRREARMAMK